MRKLNAMPNSRRLARSPLPWWRLLLLLAHYFIGYLFLYPKLLAKITLAIDPNAYYVPDSYLFLTYVWMILSTLLIAFPIWRQSHLHYRKERPDLLFSNLCYRTMFVVSLVIGLIVTHFSGLSDSANEQVVLAELERSPLLSFLRFLSIRRSLRKVYSAAGFTVRCGDIWASCRRCFLPLCIRSAARL